MEPQSQEIVASGSPAEVPNDPGKMFIGGLSWQTSPESLREYFTKYGEITEVMVMKDPTTRRSRGFGFITFADPASVDKVLAQGTHELDGKKIDPKVAFPRRAHPKMVTRTKKIFVGGLSAPTTLEDVKNYFEQFGPVSEELPNTNRTPYSHVRGNDIAPSPASHYHEFAPIYPNIAPLYAQLSPSLTPQAQRGCCTVTPVPQSTGQTYDRERDTNESCSTSVPNTPASPSANPESLYFQPSGTTHVRIPTYEPTPVLYYVPCLFVPMFANGLTLDVDEKISLDHNRGLSANPTDDYSDPTDSRSDSSADETTV